MNDTAATCPHATLNGNCVMRHTLCPHSMVLTLQYADYQGMPFMINVDLRNLLDAEGALGSLTRYVSPDGVDVRLPVRRGRFSTSRQGRPSNVTAAEFAIQAALAARAAKVTNGSLLVPPPPDDKDDDEVSFVSERTREERDEEGRANAVVLD